MEVIRYLLGKKVKVNVKDTAGMTPIDEARNNGHQAAVELMEEHLQLSPDTSPRTPRSPTEAWQ